MSKATEQNDKLKRAIIISVALHIILIALLIWSSFDEHLDASAGGGSSIDAVMVDPGAVVNNYNRQQQQQASARRAAEQRENRRNSRRKSYEKQAAEQERLKQLEQELAAGAGSGERSEGAAEAS